MSVYVSDTDGDFMPMWAPPTPPQDDNDLYIDQTLFFMYEPMPMTETQLPPVYVKKEVRKPIKVETMSRRLLQKQASTETAAQLQARKLKQRKEEAPRVPRSLFERPTATILKLRKEAKLQKLKQGLISPQFRRTATSSTSKPVMDTTQDHPEWLIHEDWALLQAVQTLLDLPLNLMVVSPAHIPNWDLVSDVVNSCSRVYRSPKQCKVRYENVIIAREEGRILYDINPRKQKKSKGIYKDLPVVSSSYSSIQTKNNRPMKTSQLFLQDNHNSVTMLHSLRFDSVKCIASKRTPTLRPTLVNPTQKNPKHAAVLAESGITYDTPLNPEKVAAIRAERIQQEKKKGQVLMLKAQTDQLAAQRTQQATVQPATATPAVGTQQVANQLQTVATAAATVLQAGTLQKGAASPATIPAVSIARPVAGPSNIIVNTAGGAAGGTFAAINKRMSQQTTGLAQASTVKTLSPQTVGQAVRAQQTVRGTALTMQELTTAVNQAQARANLAAATVKATVVTTASLTAAQLAAQRSVAGAAAVTGVTSVQTSRPLTQAQLSQLHRQQQQQQQTILKQAALHPRQIVNKVPLELRQQQLKQQLKLSQAAAGHQLNVVAGQKPVLASQLVTTIGQKTPLKPVHQLSDSDLQALIKRQQATPAGHVNIIAPVQRVGQVSGSQTQVATLVKTVAAPGVSTVPIPVTQVGPVNINVSMPGQKVAAAKNQTVSQLQHQQQRFNQIRLLQRSINQGKLGQVQQVAGKGQLQLGALQLSRPATMTFQQFVKQHQQQNQGATIQQIITSVAPSTQSSQPTIIATVTQAQPMVAKVSLATAPATSQALQTITQPSALAIGSQVSVTTQPSVATLSLTAASPQTTPQAAVVQQAVTAASPVTAATVQLQSLQAVSAVPAKLTNITHAVAQPRVTQVVHQQIPPGQVVVSAVGRAHSLAAQTPPVAAQQVVVTAAAPESAQLQTHIHRTSATAAALLAGQAASAAVATGSPQPAPQQTATLTTVPPPATAQPVPQAQPAPVPVVATSQPAAPQAPQTPQPAAQQAQQSAAPVKTAHYAMRTRQQPKH